MRKIFICLLYTSNQQTVSLKNIKAREENLIIGEKNVQCISLVDIDEVNFPSIIKPYKEVNIGLRFPVEMCISDSFNFFHI